MEIELVDTAVRPIERFSGRHRVHKWLIRLSNALRRRSYVCYNAHDAGSFRRCAHSRNSPSWMGVSQSVVYAQVFDCWSSPRPSLHTPPTIDSFRWLSQKRSLWRPDSLCYTNIFWQFRFHSDAKASKFSVEDHGLIMMMEHFWSWIAAVHVAKGFHCIFQHFRRFLQNFGAVHWLCSDDIWGEGEGILWWELSDFSSQSDENFLSRVEDVRAFNNNRLWFWLTIFPRAFQRQYIIHYSLEFAALWYEILNLIRDIPIVHTTNKKTN